MKISKFQTSQSVAIKRSEINEAVYNPRKISEEAKKMLQKNIKSVGYLGGIVVNTVNMRIVQGHQRIAILDTLEKNKDYEITVEFVTLTEKQEKEQNVFMNSSNAQGEYDLEQLGKIIMNEGFSIDNAGITPMDISMIATDDLYGGSTKEQEDSIDELYAIMSEKPSKQKTDNQKREKQNEEREKLPDGSMKEIDKKAFEALDKKNNTNYYIIVRFDSEESKAACLKSHGIANKNSVTLKELI